MESFSTRASRIRKRLMAIAPTAIAPIAPAPRANAPTATARMAVLPVLIASVALFVWVIGPFSFYLGLAPGLRLTQNWIGKSFVHAIFGPYLQRCSNKL